MMRRTALLLLVAVLAAGCTSANGSASEGGQGIEISASLADSTVFAGGSTTLVLEVTNRNSRPLEGFEARVVNRNGLRVEPRTCRDKPFTLRGSSLGVPVSRQCIWEVTAGEDFEMPAESGEVRVPLTVFATYNTSFSPRTESIKVNFLPPEDISPDQGSVQQIQAGNGDISLAVSHERPVSASAGNVPLEVSVSNRGGGRILSLKSPRETSEVEIFYEGSFTRIQGGVTGGLKREATTCLDRNTVGDSRILQDRKTLTFLEGRKRASFECQFALTENVISSNRLADRSFSLRPSVRYRYRVAQEAPLTVVDREG